MFFFFQAEDGIRDLTVTGVQTCALPIFQSRRTFDPDRSNPSGEGNAMHRLLTPTPARVDLALLILRVVTGIIMFMHGWQKRSEEHTSELQSQSNLVCRLLLEKKK